MNGWLLDTNVISELRRPRPNVRVRAFVAAQPLEELFVSTVTMAEIRYGIETVGDRHAFSQPDPIIAATALHHGLTVVARDIGDYELARVELVNP